MLSLSLLDFLVGETPFLAVSCCVESTSIVADAIVVIDDEVAAVVADAIAFVGAVATLVTANVDELL